MISRFFIDRPVLANVLAILMVVIGAVALLSLPVAQYPDVTPPTVQVQTRYPGASARTIIDTIALPIEQQVNGVENMIYMQSMSTSDGTYTLVVTFKVGTDLNFAQILVQNRVSAALSSLPDAVQKQGVTVQKQSTSILMFVTLTSPDKTFDSLYLANYGTIRLKDELARLPGVGSVVVFGAGQYSMRIWLDPEKLRARSMTAQDVTQALQQQSQQVAAGQIGAPPAPADTPFQYTVTVAGRLADVDQFENVIVKTGSAGEVTRVRDIGRVELGAQTYGQIFKVNDRPAAGIAVFQAPGANAMNVEKTVRDRVDQLAKEFPQGLTAEIPFNTTLFVDEAIKEVYKTLIEAALLVLFVILLFLQDWRAMLIPATTVPVTIIGAFAAMAALGFTVNLSTLFAIVLAIGIVVDDAIVIVEGVAHNIERGLTSHDASIKAMDELFGPIIGITLVLMSVFIPAAFMPGLTGKMYAQFALVIAATAILSAINAATLKPTQAALWMRPPVPPEKRNFIYRGFNRGYAKLERGYVRLIGAMAARSGISVAVGLVIVALAGWGLTRVPAGFIPIEDQGYLLVAAQLPDGASLERTQKAMDQIAKIARATPGVDQVVTVAGISPLDNSASLANAGVSYITLKPWSQRGKGQDLLSLFTDMNRAMQEVTDARVLVVPPPPIQGIGNASGFTMQLELRDGSFDFAKLQTMANTVASAAQGQTGLQRVMTTFRSDAPQYRIDIDRVKAQTLHVNVDQVFSTIQTFMGSTFVVQFNKFGRTFQAYVQADAQFRLRPEEISSLTVRNQQGGIVPIGTLAQVVPTTGPPLISLYNLYPTAMVMGMPAQGFSSGQAMTLMEQIAARTLPAGANFEWSAMSYQEKIVGNQMYLVFALGLLLVYLVLAGQYESWYTPLAIVLSVPLALVGPASILIALKIDANLYVQIGLILLIALSAKNAILIVEVARERRLHEGLSIVQSAVEAARARFRPILMTSIAFILSVVPLVIATGAGASARKSIGITVFTGMIASTCLAVLFVPSLFVVIQRFEEWLQSRKARKATLPSETGAG
ncbi:MAG: efflux RND transporter permease subunit [Xanthobacteraceae bacterium]